MTEDNSLIRIDELEMELEDKEHELIGYLDKIEQLEVTIRKLETLIPKEGLKESKRKGKKGAEVIDNQSAFELEEKDVQLRELKNKMGFLRKEKIQQQQELERFKAEKAGNKGLVIRIEEKKEPFENLVKELTLKLKKQKIIIEKLKKGTKKDTIKLNQEIVSPSSKKSSQSYKKETNIIIQGLKNEINKKGEIIKELNQTISQLKKVKGGQVSTDKNDSSEDNFKALSKELQIKLNKIKAQFKELQKENADLKLYKAPLGENSEPKILDELRSAIEKIPLRNQIKSKVESTKPQKQKSATEYFDLILRLNESKSLIDDLNKQNVQQRLEISKLRKKGTH